MNLITSSSRFFYLSAAALLMMAAVVAALQRGCVPGGTARVDQSHIVSPDNQEASGLTGDPDVLRNAKAPARQRSIDNEGKEPSGYNYGVYLAGKEVALSELVENLEGLRKRLKDEEFYIVMEMVGASRYFSPQDKAAVFNRFLPKKPINDAPPVGRVYLAAISNWGRTPGAPNSGNDGMVPENADGIFQFLHALDSHELKVNLAINYYTSNINTKFDLRGLLQEQADMTHDSLLGSDVSQRSLSLKNIIRSLVSSNMISGDEAVDLVKDLEIDGQFRNSLVLRLEGKELP